MNTPGNFDDERCRREWEAQERALREERQKTNAAGDDARVMQYRLIARALRHHPIDPLPENFAAQTAARIESLAEATDERFEMWLQRGLIALLAIGGITTTVIFSNDWLHALTLRALPTIELGSRTIDGWSLLVMECLGLSWAIEHWRRQIKHS